MRKSVLIFLTLGFGAVTTFAADPVKARGSCEAMAEQIYFSSTETPKTVTLVNEYNPLEDINTGVGTYICKVTLARKTSNSVWLTFAAGDTNRTVSITGVDTATQTSEPILIQGRFIDLKFGASIRWIMYADSWYYDPEWPEFSDPAQATFYITIKGEIGEKAVLHYRSGIALQEGLETTPVEITFPEKTEAKKDGTMTADHIVAYDNCAKYFFKAPLTAGRKYLYYTTGGMSSYPLYLEAQDYGVQKPYSAKKTPYNEAVSFVPSENGKYTIVVTGGVDVVEQPFAFHYQVLPQRTMSAHQPAAFTVGTTRTDCRPGRINEPESGAYDAIIDKNLFSFAATKGKRYVAYTEGATGKKVQLLMRLYKADGTILVENDGYGNGGYDALIGYQAEATTTYYIGFCQKLEDDDNDPLAECPVSFTLEEVTGVDGQPDAFDAADDTYKGAVTLHPAIADYVTNDVVALDQPGHGPHRLDRRDWTDVFAVDAIKGITYCFATSLEGSAPEVQLKADAFTVNAYGTETPVALKGGSLSQPMNGLYFTADSTTRYYIRLSVAGRKAGTSGSGLDYPAYRLHATASLLNGYRLGRLTVETKGTTAGYWTVKGPNGNDTTQRRPGETILTWGANTVTFSSVSGFSRPADQTVTVNGDEKTVLGIYSDTFDPKDDYTQGKYKVGTTTYSYGATAITVGTTVGKADRTLFAEDPADCFSFNVNTAALAGDFYKIWLEAGKGNPVFSVTNALVDGAVVPATASVDRFRFAQSAKPYQLAVVNGTAETDSEYVLRYVRWTPASLTPSAAGATKSGKFVEGETYVKMSLTAGNKYTLTTTGADALEFYEPDSEAASALPLSGDFFPERTGAYIFWLHGEATGSYTFKASVAGVKTVANHRNAAVAAPDTAYTVEPTFVHNPEEPQYWDGIVDGTLLKVSLLKGKSYRVETFGAETNKYEKGLVLYVYDANGKILQTNRGNGVDANVVAIVEPTANATYYFGLAEETDEIGGKFVKVGQAVDVKVSEVVQADDAEPLDAVPGEGEPTVVDAEGAGPVALGAGRWTKTFALAARKDITYRVKAKFADAGAETPYALQARVYTLSGTAQKDVVTTADVSPEAEGRLSLKATANATHYLEFSVADGKGLLYPEFTVHCSATSDAGALGRLTVNLQGVADVSKMAWKILKIDNKTPSPAEVFYPAGSSVLVPDGTYAIGAQTVSGFQTPPSAGFTNVVFKAADGATALYKYTDTADPKDDKPAGATAWTLKNTLTSFDRTFWAEDPEDNFSFMGTDGYFYDFAVTNVVGDAVFMITNATHTAACPDGIYYFKVGREVQHLVLPKLATKYYLSVQHLDDPPQDGSYRIQGKFANVGNLKFSSTAISANENAGTVTFTVNRTAKDGRVRVKYGTVAGTAKPGEDYLAQNGILEWADGDNKAKTVTVKLVPDLVPTYEGANKTFALKLAPIPEYERAVDEYEATFPVDARGVTLDTATVTLKEVTKATPGTIQVADCEDPKKPVFEVVAGEEVSFFLERIAGVDGLVGVKVETVKGTANKSGETDFEPMVTTNLWEDGVAGTASLPIVVRTKPNALDFTATKSFTIKLTALKTNTAKDKSGQLIDPTVYATPTFAAATITVNLRNEKYALTTTEWGKALPKTDGVTAVRESKSNSWFLDGTGEAYSTVTRTFKGPSCVRWGLIPDEGESGGGMCGPDLPLTFANVVYIPSGKSQSITMRSDEWYEEEVLKEVTPAVPTVDKAVVAAGDVEFRFDDGWYRENVLYRVFVLKRGETAKSAATGRTMVLGDPETELFPDEEGCYVSNLVANATYTWRVDPCFVDDDGGISVSIVGKTWTLNTLPENAPTVRVVQVVDGEEIAAEDGWFWLSRGVPVEIRIYGDSDAQTTLTKISGNYPSGLSVPTLMKPDAQDKTTWYWKLAGTPNKASDESVVLLQLKAGTVPYVTCALTFWVDDIPTASAVFPADKSVLPADTDEVILNCGLGTGGLFGGICGPESDTYRLFIVPAADKSKLGRDETEIARDKPNSVEPGKQYYWQAFTFNEGGTVTNKSAQFTFTVAADGARTTEVKGEDAWGDEYEPGRQMWLEQRLYAEFEIADPTATKVALVSGTGSLPTGLKLEQDRTSKRWYVRGTPTKEGDFSVLVQATYGNVPAATARLWFYVEAVEVVPDITFTLTGPGAFTYTAKSNFDSQYEDEPTPRTEYIAAGSKSLVLKDITELVEWNYVQLPKATALAPTADKAVVQPGETELSFSRASGSACGPDNGICYRVYILDSTARGLSLGKPETEIFEPFKTNLAVNAKYTWRVDSFFKGGTVTNVSSVFTLSTATAAAAGLTTPVFGRDAYNQPVEEGETVRLLQGIKVKLTLGEAEGAMLSTTDTFAKVAGNLPTGLSIVRTQVKSGTKVIGYVNTIEGVPTKTGEFQAVLQRTSGPNKGSTVTLDFEVGAIDYAIGSFNGVMAEDGSSLTNGYPAMGSISLTTTSAGQLTAKVRIAGTDYSFSGKGFDLLLDEGETLRRTLAADLELVKKIGTVTYTNRLSLTVRDGSSSDLELLGKVGGEARLVMAVPDANNKGAQEDIVYLGSLYRDNTKSADYLKAFERFVGYYTVALPIVNPEPGKPQGNGYLTLTLDSKGKSKVGGKLADKAATGVSCAYVPALIGDLSDPDGCELIVPVFQTAKPYVLGGELHLRMTEVDGEVVPVVDSSYELLWCNDDAAQTYFGDGGWASVLSPCGGWYNTVYSLQTYYLSSNFSLDAGKTDDLPTELLKSGYAFVASTMPTGEALGLTGDKFETAKQVMIKRADGAYDLNICTNPSNVKVTFTRATGLVSGSFDVWTQNPSASGSSSQQKLSGFSYNGVYLFSRDRSPYLADDVWAPGFFLTPQFKVGNRTIKLSRPFNIKAEDQGDPDWWKDDWGEEDPFQ